jgi:DNA-binding transcriptional LysR family regulator
MSLSGVDLNLLVVLDALFEEQSVTRAAKRVGLSQPALSNALARLRVRLGDPLFVRTSTGMVPTPRAAELVPEVRAALRRIEQALADSAPFQPATTKRVFRVLTTDYVEMALFPKVLARMRKEAPDADLEIRPGTSGGMPPREPLERGEIDVAIGVFLDDHGHERVPERGIVGAPLFRETFVGLVRTGHPLLRGALTPERYASYPHVLIAPRGGRSGYVDRALAAHGLERRVQVLTPSYMTAPWLLIGTDLVLTLARRTAEALVDVLPLASFEPPIAIEGFVVAARWHERQAKDAGHRWFRKLLTDVAKDV